LQSGLRQLRPNGPRGIATTRAASAGAHRQEIETEIANGEARKAMGQERNDETGVLLAEIKLNALHNLLSYAP